MPLADYNPFDPPGVYTPPEQNSTQVRVASPRNKSANKSALVLWKDERERTLESLLADESAVLLAAEFLDLPPSRLGWGTEKGEPFVFGPKAPSHPKGIYMLSEWFHVVRTDELRKLTPTENAVWGTRLFVEMGLLDPAPLPGVPSEGYWMRSRVKGGSWTMPEKEWNHLRVLASFRCLAGIHWLTFPGRPVAFTRQYAAAWCGVPLWTTYGAIRDLTRAFWLRAVPMKGKRANHFLPGNGKPPEGGSQTLSPTRTAHPQQGASEDSGTNEFTSPAQGWIGAARHAQELSQKT
jgi:hypothetical protein